MNFTEPMTVTEPCLILLLVMLCNVVGRSKSILCQLAGQVFIASRDLLMKCSFLIELAFEMAQIAAVLAVLILSLQILLVQPVVQGIFWLV